jgi:dUTPase
MKTTKIKNIKKEVKQTYDITVKNNHNFFCNNHLIHNCDYRGEIGLIIMNTDSVTPFNISNGDRMAQGVLNQVNQCEWDSVYHLEELGQTERDSDGFGTTGIK